MRVLDLWLVLILVPVLLLSNVSNAHILFLSMINKFSHRKKNIVVIMFTTLQ